MSLPRAIAAELDGRADEGTGGGAGRTDARASAALDRGLDRGVSGLDDRRGQRPGAAAESRGAGSRGPRHSVRGDSRPTREALSVGECPTCNIHFPRRVTSPPRGPRTSASSWSMLSGASRAAAPCRRPPLVAAPLIEAKRNARLRRAQALGRLEPLPVTGILAIVRLREGGQLPLLAPDLVSGSFGASHEECIPLCEVPINGGLRIVQRLVIAVVND